MAGLLDRLLGREPEKKAVVGTGAYWMEHGVPLRSISRDPLRLLGEAQKVYHSNEWVHAAESLIDSKFATVAWHLERAGETVEEESELQRLLRKPAPDMTRTHLWRITCRHLGLTGNAFWYLDQQDVLGTPTQILYLNPARMTPRLTGRGQLGGWIVDADRPDGHDPIPLDLAEVIHFVLDPPDYGYYGIGKVEAAWRKVGLSNATGSFAEGTFLSGGRKAHMIWPDGVTVEGDAWDQWTNGLRNAQEEGTFTRRLTANKFPIGSLETGQTMRELQVPDLANLSRDDLLALWGVPGSALGIVQSRGLNSGETQKYEEAALWQNAIEPRLAVFAETIQARLVDPFGLTLIVETPEFDDDKPLYEVAEKARSVPHKADELRALVGLDPLDPAAYGELGQVLLMGKDIVQFSELVPVVRPENPDDDAEMPTPGEISGKARVNLANLHRSVVKRYQPQLDAKVSEALSAQAAAIAKAVTAKHGHLQAKPNDTTIWWNEQREHDRLRSALAPIVAKIVTEVGSHTRAGFAFPAKADFDTMVAEYVEQRAGDRIRSINTTTRDALRTLIADGISSGLSPAELGTSITEATSFNEARAEMIARTETGYAYNDTAIGTYRAFEVTEVDVIDGDVDDVCAHANGSRWTLEEASANPLGHPNCTRDFLPVVKAEVEPNPLLLLAESNSSLTKALLGQAAPVFNVYPAEAPSTPITVNVPEQVAPSVYMDAPVVNVHPSPVTVNVPEQAAPVVNVTTPEVKAILPDQIAITSLPKRIKTATRRADGMIEEMTETDG